jgi:taurine--2-oxoglutarate transaminase
MKRNNNLLTAQEIVNLNRQYTFFSWSVQSATNPIPISRAEGVYFWDSNGKKYIDF